VGLDALLRKYFIAVVLGMVAMAAYFQAAGAMQLVGTAMLPDRATLTVAPKAAPSAAPAAPKVRSAEPILARNPFDSVTGPLNAKPAAEALSQAQPDLSNPLQAPRCEGITVTIVTESTDPAWSIAAMRAPGDAVSKLRRVGDQIGSAQIAFIGFNIFEGRPSVWLTEGARLCQSLMFAPPVAAAPPGAASAPPTPGQPPGAPSPLASEIASKIQKLSPTEFNIDRAVVEKVLENQAELMKSARIVPEKGADGNVVGVRLFGIRPDTLLGTLGFQNGDRLETINGFNMASPEKALEAYARLRTAPNLNIKVNRRGQPVNMDMHIK
jgi:general secretion pathway protein C